MREAQRRGARQPGAAIARARDRAPAQRRRLAEAGVGRGGAIRVPSGRARRADRRIAARPSNPAALGSARPGRHPGAHCTNQLAVRISAPNVPSPRSRPQTSSWLYAKPPRARRRIAPRCRRDGAGWRHSRMPAPM